MTPSPDPDPGEGTCFAVAYDRGRWARGVLARHAGQVGLGYFFGPPLPDEPGLEDFAGLDPAAAIYACRVGDVGLRNGQWRPLGTLPGFEHDAWPIPRMSHVLEVGEFGFVYDYGDDLGGDPAEERVGLDAARGHPPVGLHLPGAVERVLFRALA